MEVLNSKGITSVHFDLLTQELSEIGINDEEVDEAISWLLQRQMIIELERIKFSFRHIKRWGRDRVLSRLLQRGDPCRDPCISMVSDASGWYARLDRECSDRVEQLLKMVGLLGRKQLDMESLNCYYST